MQECFTINVQCTCWRGLTVESVQCREAKMAVESRVRNLEGTLAAKMEEMKALRNRIPRLEADVQAAKEQAFKVQQKESCSSLSLVQGTP